MSGSTVDVAMNLGAPHLPKEHRLQGVVRSYLNRRAPPSAPQAEPWSASFFGLTQVPAFARAGAQVQQAVVHRCGQQLFEEAYAIEKIGMAYCAKLILVSDTTEERMTYSHIAGDEATHLSWVAPYVERPDACLSNPFVRLMADTVESQSKQPLYFLLQCVLEGWGLVHYQRLAESCADAALAERLHRIVVDERLHHGTGNVLFNPRELTEAERAFLTDALAGVLQMVRVGPQGVVIALCEGLGGASASERAEMFAALDTERQSHERLQLLRSLVAGRGLDDVLQRLDAMGLFEALPAVACAQVSQHQS